MIINSAISTQSYEIRTQHKQLHYFTAKHGMLLKPNALPLSVINQTAQ